MGKLNGPFEMYWGNGNLMGEEFYVDGLPQGISTYYKTGEVMEIVLGIKVNTMVLLRNII